MKENIPQKMEEIKKSLRKCNNKGITIISLAITIIIMLILAGVTINLTLGENGIFGTAKEAEEKHKISEYLDRIELARGAVSLENMGEVTLDNLIAQIYEEKIVPDRAITKLDEEKAKMTTTEGYVFIITADKVEFAGKGEAVATPPDLQEGDVIFNLTPDTWTNGNVKVRIEGNIKDEFTLQYSLDAVNWEDYKSAIEITENRTIYACIRNAIGEKGNYASTTISIIDKIDPIEFTPSITSTTNSITVDASNAKDGEATSKYGESGIKEIWYSDDAGTTWKTNEEDKSNTNYTFNELIQGKEYEIQVKVIDNAGNQIITKAQKITTTSVTGLTIRVTDADTWTNGTKTVTITATNSNYSTIRYTTDGSVATTSSTEYTAPFTVSSNCIITAVAFDSTNQVGLAATGIVGKIDKTNPQLADISLTATSTITTSNVKATVTLKDNESGVNISSSKYIYTTTKDAIGITDTSKYTTSFAENPQTLTLSATTPGTYYLHILTVDNAGNMIETISDPIIVSYPTLASKAKPGDYVKYDGGNGYTGLWQVLYNNSTYGLQIISAQSVKDFTLGDTSSADATIVAYNNSVDRLNTECRKYVNTSYSASGRCVGSNPLSPNDAVTNTYILPSNFGGSSNSYGKVADNNYVTDYNAMKAATNQNSAGIHDINKLYFLASRQTFMNEAQTVLYFDVRGVEDDGRTSGVGYESRMWDVTQNKNYHYYTRTRGLRPVITLKSGIQTSSGSGTSGSPYVLVAK